MNIFVLYTYAVAAGTTVCHAYGCDDKAEAQAEGAKLQAAFEADPSHSFSQFTFMVLPLEAMPA
jgi:hypothetical protein